MVELASFTIPSVERDWAIVRGVNEKQASAIKPLAIVL
jgi:hypothetical protein